MINVDYLILGGGVAGTTAAETVRQNDLTGSIMIVEAEPETLYSKVMLTDLLKGTASDAQIHLRQPANYQEKKIELKFAQITSIDLASRTITLQNNEQIQGKQILVALGTQPKPFNVPGVQLKGIYNIRNLAQTRPAVADLANVKEVVIVGGGFIGLEAYEAMMTRKIKATILARGQWYFYPKIEEIEGQMISDIMVANGAPVYFEDECVEIIGSERVEKVKTKKGLEIPCQMIIVGIGVVPNTSLLTKTGLSIDERGVAVDKYLATNIANVWAAGDIANFDDVISGTRHPLGNWANATGQGVIAGRNMAAANLGKTEKTEFRIVSAYTVTAPGINLSFLGNTSDGIENDTVLLSDKNNFIRLFINRERGNLSGAIMLNNPQVLGVLHKTITSGVDLRPKMPALKGAPGVVVEVLK